MPARRSRNGGARGCGRRRRRRRCRPARRARRRPNRLRPRRYRCRRRYRWRRLRSVEIDKAYFSRETVSAVSARDVPGPAQAAVLQTVPPLPRALPVVGDYPSSTTSKRGIFLNPDIVPVERRRTGKTKGAALVAGGMGQPRACIALPEPEVPAPEQRVLLQGGPLQQPVAVPLDDALGSEPLRRIGREDARGGYGGPATCATWRRARATAACATRSCTSRTRSKRATAGARRLQPAMAFGFSIFVGLLALYLVASFICFRSSCAPPSGAPRRL